MRQYNYFDELYHQGVKGMKWGKHLTTAQVNKAASDTIEGKYGNGQERRNQLGSNYDQIQSKVNEKLSSKEKSKETTEKTDDKSKMLKTVKNGEKLAKQVINGKFGNGAERVKALGNKYAYVQNIVNEKLYGKERAKAIAKKYGWDFSTTKKSKTTKATKNKKSSEK